MPQSKGRPRRKPAPSSRAMTKGDPVNPTWWAPVFVTLLVLGLVWIVVFYVTSGAWPIEAFGYWNLVAGFGLLLTGFAMTMRWH